MSRINYEIEVIHNTQTWEEIQKGPPKSPKGDYTTSSLRECQLCKSELILIVCPCCGVAMGPKCFDDDHYSDFSHKKCLIIHRK